MHQHKSGGGKRKAEIPTHNTMKMDMCKCQKPKHIIWEPFAGNENEIRRKWQKFRKKCSFTNATLGYFYKKRSFFWSYYCPYWFLSNAKTIVIYVRLEHQMVCTILSSKIVTMLSKRKKRNGICGLEKHALFILRSIGFIFWIFQLSFKRARSIDRMNCKNREH